MNIQSANNHEQAMTLATLPSDILQEIIDTVTRDYWSVAAAADEEKMCRTGSCYESSAILLGGEACVQAINANWQKHLILQKQMRNVKIARLHGIDNHINYGINDTNWNPWLSSLAATCRQLRSRIMDDVILQCLRIRGLKERELVSALEMFGEDRLQVTRIIAVDWDPIIAHHGNFWNLLNEKFPSVQHIIMHADDENPKDTSLSKFFPFKGRIPMIIPSPTRPLESLDLHICPTLAAKLQDIRIKDRAEVERLVLRLTSRSELHDHCTNKASRDAVNRTMKHYRSIRTLCIHDASSSPWYAAYRSAQNQSPHIKPLLPADLPDLEVLILKRLYRQTSPGLESLLAKATQLASSQSGAFQKLRNLKVIRSVKSLGHFGDSDEYWKMAAMSSGEGIPNGSTLINAQAHHMLRKELAEFDAVTLGLSQHVPSLASVEIEIVRQSDSLEKPIFKYLCFVELDNEGRKTTLGTLSLEESIAKSLVAYADTE